MELITDLWSAIQLEVALAAMVDGVGDQVAKLLPIGISIMFALSIPRIAKRVVGAFL